jgi:hypothetical protein
LAIIINDRYENAMPQVALVNLTTSESSLILRSAVFLHPERSLHTVKEKRNLELKLSFHSISFTGNFHCMQ